MTEPEPATTYTQREATHSARAHQLDRWSLWLGVVRLLVVVAALAYALAAGLTLPWVVATVAAFVALAMVQAPITRGRDTQRRLAQVNRRELSALRGEAPFGPACEAPPPLDHRYADDLEIFAEHGLFRLLNRATTAMGRRTLAGWLAVAADPDTIRARQDAARELAPQVDHRQALAAQGLPAEGDQRQARATALLATTVPEPEGFDLPAWVLLGLPAATLGAGIAAWSIPAAVGGFYTLVGVQSVLGLLGGRRIARLLRESSGCAGVVKAYAAILETIETHPSGSPQLRQIQTRLRDQGVAASVAIRRLGVLLEWMDVRNSAMLWLILNTLLLWDLNCAGRLARWQRRFRPSLGGWLDGIGEWEALSSLAGAAFNNPGWTWPTLLPAGHGLRAEALGHPLIPGDERVPAQVHLPAPGSIWIVTGPNMAGKSTFLRTVGVGLVMAQAGAPVCARRFHLSPLQLITSMRISDSLDKKLSLFYAELQRLKQILDAVDAGEPVFFLIDEMLKGTNTLDRQAGAVALVRQLQRAGASGIVATHDLALARLAAETPDAIANFHFDGTVDGDRLTFDYRLREGACERFNALSLMRAIGIHLDEPARASFQDPE